MDGAPAPPSLDVFSISCPLTPYCSMIHNTYSLWGARKRDSSPTAIPGSRMRAADGVRCIWLSTLEAIFRPHSMDENEKA
jgi:hypothetical protein